MLRMVLDTPIFIVCIFGGSPVLWAYGPSTRIIYARLYYRHPFRYSLELVGMNPLLSLYQNRTWRVLELDSKLSPALHLASLCTWPLQWMRGRASLSQFSGWCPHASGTGSEVGA